MEIYPAWSDLLNCNNLYHDPEMAGIYCGSGTISHACSDVIFGSAWLCLALHWVGIWSVSILAALAGSGPGPGPALYKYILPGLIWLLTIIIET
jgi:hypothetical protein